MASTLILHADIHEEPLESEGENEYDLHLLDKTDTDMELDDTPPIKPKKFVPKKIIYGPGASQPKYTKPRTPAQARLGWKNKGRNLSQQTLHYNKPSHTTHHTHTKTSHPHKPHYTKKNWSKDTTQQQQYANTSKRTLLPAPVPTPTPVPAPFIHSSTTPIAVPLFSQPPPAIVSTTMTEHILNELARLVIDEAKGRYNIRLNEATMKEAIIRARET